MNRIPKRTKVIAAAIGVLMSIVLVVGGTFAWLIINRTPEVKKMKVNVTNSTILEIAQAYPENYLTGPPEVGENDANKKRIVDGKQITDQGVWGRVVDMTDSQIILQEPATFDEKTQTLSTVKFDRTGRTNGFQTLIKEKIDDNGIVYFTKEVNEGNYRGEDGYIHTASPSMATDSVASPSMTILSEASEASPSDASPSSGVYTPPTSVKCAGGVAVWMRSNKPTSEEVFLKGLTISKAKDGGTGIEEVTENDILGVIVSTYHLKKSAEAKAKEKKTGIPQEGELEPFNNYYAQKTDNGYVCTLFAGTSAQQMQPGELYLVEIICYIEGDRENGQGNNAAVAGNTGESKKISFNSIECKDVLYAAKVTEENGTERHNGWFAGPTKLKIELFGTSDQVDNKNIIVEYELIAQDDPSHPTTGSFMAFDDSGKRNSKTIDLSDGVYQLTVRTAQTDATGKADETKQMYYTVSIGDTSMVNTVKDSMTVRVDTIKPVVETTLNDCTCAYSEENGTTYHNHDVTVIATAQEKNLSTFRIAGTQITPSTISESGDLYKAERLYAKEGDYTVPVVVTDRSGKTNESPATSSSTGLRTDEVHFIIDKTKPQIEGVKWGFTNDSGMAAALNKITGSTFFNKAVQAQITAKDDHILSMGLNDSKGPLSCNIVKDTDGQHITATVNLPMDYNDEITVTMTDKAGNTAVESTGVVFVSDKLPETEETHTGQKSKPDEDPVVWYDITYHLTPADPNAQRVTGFEYSRNGSNWYSTDMHMEKVYYKVGKDVLDGDTVTIYCDDYETVSGTIYFRAVTDIISDPTSAPVQYVRGNSMYRNYKLEAIIPPAPTVQASNGASPQIPRNGNIEFKLSGSDTYKLNVDHYEYSMDCTNWYSTEKDFENITVKVGGSKNEDILVEGKDGTDTSSQIYFRAVSSKADNPSILVSGTATEMCKFEIDKENPVISDAQWGYVNDGGVAGTLSNLTGNLFFNKKIMVQVKAEDKNIDDVTCQTFEVVNTRPSLNTIIAKVYVEPDFDGTITLTASDKAGNSSNYTTSRVRVNTLTVTEIPYTNALGYQGHRYELTLPDSVDAVSTLYEYSLDGGTNWYYAPMQDDDYNYTFDSSYLDNYLHVFEVESRNLATPSHTELPAAMSFRVTVTNPSGDTAVYTAENGYTFIRQWP